MAQSISRARLDAAAVQALAASLPGWGLSADGKAVARRFKFRDFDAALDFVNRLAPIANRLDHHPDLSVGWGYCEVLFTTHDAGGLTQLDAEAARATQALADGLARGAGKAHKYQWSSLPVEQVNPAMTRQMLHGDRILVAATRFKGGYRVPQHQHPHEQITLVHSGRLQFLLGADRSETIEVGPGEALVIPGNVPHEALCIGEVDSMDVFSPVREDWLDGSDTYLRG
ncbi:MAG TPA: 4a-hydroxytetrahydrobiopterin dehydratase [Steroidobacteraceae bacterium]